MLPEPVYACINRILPLQIACLKGLISERRVFIAFAETFGIVIKICIFLETRGAFSRLTEMF